MEYALGGSVKNRLTKEGAFNEIQAIRYTWQMLLGVSYLHRQRIIHRDLKCKQDNQLYSFQRIHFSL